MGITLEAHVTRSSEDGPLVAGESAFLNSKKLEEVPVKLYAGRATIFTGPLNGVAQYQAQFSNPYLVVWGHAHPFKATSLATLELLMENLESDPKVAQYLPKVIMGFGKYAETKRFR